MPLRDQNAHLGTPPAGQRLLEPDYWGGNQLKLRLRRRQGEQLIHDAHHALRRPALNDTC